jgi:hypothetical protein
MVTVIELPGYRLAVELPVDEHPDEFGSTPLQPVPEQVANAGEPGVSTTKMAPTATSSAVIDRTTQPANLF